MTMNLYCKTVFDDFTSIGVWGDATGNLASSGYGASRNTDTAYIKTGKASMKLFFDYDASTDGRIVGNYTNTYDFSKYDEVWVNLYVDDVNDLDSTVAFLLSFGTSASHYLSSPSSLRTRSNFKNGWNVLKIPIKDMSTYGAPDITEVDWFGVRSDDNGVSDYVIYMDSVWLMKKIILHNTMSPVSRRLRGRAAGYTIPRRTTPLVQTTGVEPSEWSLDFTLLNSYNGSTVSYGGEYDRVLSSSQLEDCLLKPCVLEPDLASSTIDFRDDDGSEDNSVDFDDENDYRRKFVYVPTITNLKTATVYAYIKEDASNPPEDGDTVDIKVNGVWHVGAWSGVDTTSSYQWLTLDLSPELLVEGWNEIQMRCVGVSASDIFVLGIDSTNDYNRSHGSTDAGVNWSPATGEYMIYVSCTYEHLSQYSTTPRHVIPTAIDFNYQAGRVHTLPYRMAFVEDTM